MSRSLSVLPDSPSLDYLKKLAKERLRELRRTDPAVRLAQAQLLVARDHGFPSWRALKAEVDRRRASRLEGFFAACAAGDVGALRRLLDDEPVLVRERLDGQTGLHVAVRQVEAVRLLIERGAEVNARDEGDHALPLHLAAGEGELEVVRALLDAGSEVHGRGDLHELEVIGWAACFAEVHHDVVELLVERGARHHVFSAIAVGDLALLRRLVAEDPGALRRRLSRFEQAQSALHFVISPPDGLVCGWFQTVDRYGALDVLLELGADVEAQDAKERTPLAVAMLRGDREAMRRLHAAGARAPELRETPSRESVAPLGLSMGPVTPMLAVADVEATVSWYRSLGFELLGSHEDAGRMDWARVKLAQAEVMFVPAVEPWRPATRGLSLWIATDQLEALYDALKRRQLDHGRSALTGEGHDTPEVCFTQDLHTAFYGQREFGVRDPNGVELTFTQAVPG